MSQRELVDAARHGDAGAFGVLARQHADRVYALTNRILVDPGAAEDAAQQALIKAWRDLPSLRDPDLFDGWLRRVVVRACYDQAGTDRRWRAQIRLLPEVEPAADPTGALAARDEMERAMTRLKPQQRAVLVMRFYLDLPVAEIAATLEVSVGTVSSRLHYALAELRSILEADARVGRAEGRTA